MAAKKKGRDEVAVEGREEKINSVKFEFHSYKEEEPEVPKS